VSCFLFMFVRGTSHSRRGEAVWSAPEEALLSSGRGTSFVPLNQSKNIFPYNQQPQLVGGAHGLVSICTESAFSNPSSSVRYIQSSQLSTNPMHVDAGFAGVHARSNPESQTLSTAQNVDRSFGAVSLKSQEVSGLKPDNLSSYSAMSGTTAGMYKTPGVGAQGVSHLPTHGWGSATAVFRSRCGHIPATGWQNVLQQQADIELASTPSSIYSTVAPQTSFVSALQTSMQYCTIDSPVTTVAGISSLTSSPYADKTYTDGSSSESSSAPVQIQQQQYIESLLQLHYLLLASNKLQAAARHPASLGAAGQFDIPRSMTSVPRPTAFDVTRLQSLSPGTYFTAAARFPRSAQH